MRVGIIGCGAIGTDVALAAEEMKEISKIYIYDININASKKLQRKLKKAQIKPVNEFLEEVDFVFEAASQDAVIEYASDILTAGKDIIIMSVGSLFNNKFKNKIEKIAQDKGCKIYIPAGAICGIDGVISASIDTIDEVTLVTTKSPESLGKKLSKRTVVFDGNARHAVKKFPSNINVAASLSIAGVGFDNTKVRIVADPVVTRISHRILAHGKFGRLRAEVENMPNPKNPKSSYMASLSAIATLKKIVNPIQIGA
jgi:aspartate dehydrogenase